MTALVIICTGVWDEKHQANILLGETKPVPQSALAAEGSTEYARLQQALATAEDDATTMTVAVRDGRQDQVAFIGRDGVIENAQLMQAGQPFTGTLTYVPATGAITPSDLVVSGKMLQNSSALTALAFQRGLSPIVGGGNYIVTLCVFLFALSTIISWSYYGDRCVTYLFGAAWVRAYRLLYVGFAFAGSVLALEVVWAFGDLALGIMAIPNLISVLLLSPKLIQITRDYFNKYKDA